MSDGNHAPITLVALVWLVVQAGMVLMMMLLLVGSLAALV